MNFDIKIPNLENQMEQFKNQLLNIMAQPVADIALNQVHNAFENQGQPGTAWPKKSIGEGKVLDNTGNLKDSFSISDITVNDDEATITISSSNILAKYHHYGFKTNGPNFIPLNNFASTTHVNGANPNDEGLIYGKDYIIAKHGVTVPSRPLIDYSNDTNVQEIVDTIIKAIGDK